MSQDLEGNTNTSVDLTGEAGSSTDIVGIAQTSSDMVGEAGSSVDIVGAVQTSLDIEKGSGAILNDTRVLLNDSNCTLDGYIYG
jgi:hypothetical protein